MKRRFGFVSLLFLSVFTHPALSTPFDPTLRLTQIAIERMLERGAWEEAFVRSREELGRFPDDPFLIACRIRSLRMLGYRQTARALLDDAIRRHPSDPWLLVERGWERASRGDWGELLSLLPAPRPSDDLPLDYHLLRGVALRRTGKPDEALTAFDVVLSRNPSHCEALINKGKILGIKGDHDAARKWFEKAVGACPGSPEPLRLIGEVEIVRNRFPQGVDAFEKALAISPTDLPTLRAYRDAAQKMGNSETEQRLLERLVLLFPEDPLFKERLCTLSSDGTAPDDCSEFLLQRSPDDPSLIRATARRRIREGRLEDALSLYDRLVSLRPLDHQLMLERSLILTQMKRYDEAISACSTIIERSQLASAYGLRGYARYLKGERTLAEEDAANALILDRQERTALLVTVLSAIDSADRNRVNRSCSVMTSRHPDFFPGVAACAKGYLTTGDMEKGVPLAEKLIRTAPERDESRELSRILSGVSPPGAIPRRTSKSREEPL